MTAEKGRWILKSDNRDAESFPALPGVRPIAALEEVIHPEDLAPEKSKPLKDDELVKAFHEPPRHGRVDGHLFLLLTDLAELQATTIKPNPGESAFVLVRPQGKNLWRYAGVAAWSEDVHGFVMKAKDAPGPGSFTPSSP